MGKSDQNSSSGQHRQGKRKNKARMNYLKKVKQSGGGTRGRGGGRGGGSGAHQGQEGASEDGSGFLYNYVSSYNRSGQVKRNRRELTAGMRGFLLTTNFRESDCVKEGYNLLNEYYVDEKVEVGAAASASNPDNAEPSENIEKSKPETEATTEEVKNKKDEEDEEEDIDAALQKEMKELKHDFAERKFQSVDTKVKNIVFISTTVTSPADIVYRIFEDAVKNKESKSRNILRFLPIQGSCHADEQSIRQLAKEIFTPYFKDDYKTFKVVVNIRYSAKIGRDETIKILAEVVNEVNQLSVVNLKESEFTIIAEIFRATFCLSIVRHFNRFKKFNLAEAALPDVEQSAQAQGPTIEKVNETSSAVEGSPPDDKPLENQEKIESESMEQPSN